VVSDLVHTGGVQPTPDDIRAQLDRMLASDAFVNAERLSRFLRYVVGRTLAGEGDQLKEYVIGVEVFDRDDRYDPRVDSIVRVEARRLRGKVDEYYSQDGRNDAVFIQIRRGSYTPVFEPREATQAAPADAGAPTSSSTSLAGWRVALGVIAVLVLTAAVAVWRAGAGATREPGASSSTHTTTIAVLPFADYSTDAAGKALAAGITDGVTSELARIGTLGTPGTSGTLAPFGVVSRTSALQFEGTRIPLREIARTLNADFVVEGTVKPEGDQVHVNVRLVDTSIDRKVWVEDFLGARSELGELHRRIASATAAATAAARPAR
jgi:TolB-like protein